MTDRTPLLDPALRATLPPLKATEQEADPIVQAKLFTPWSDWTWFITEFDGDDHLFGMVIGQVVEWGSFSLKELEELRSPKGFVVERDLHFLPKPASEAVGELGGRHTPDGGACSEDPSSPCQAFNAQAHSMVEGGVPRGSGLEEAARAAEPRAALPFPSPFEDPGIQLVDTSLALGRALGERRVLASPYDAAALLREFIGVADREHFVALYLDARHAPTHVHVVSRGSLQSTLAHPREVFKGAVLANAAALVVGHNHPSGNVKPSVEDDQVFSRLWNAGEILGITLVDSIIVEPGGTFSATSLGDGTHRIPGASDGEAPLSRGGASGSAPSARESLLEQLCHGLLRDIDDVRRRQGGGWWEATVSSGSRHLSLADQVLGGGAYRPRTKEADPPDTKPPEP